MSSRARAVFGVLLLVLVVTSGAEARDRGSRRCRANVTPEEALTKAQSDMEKALETF